MLALAALLLPTLAHAQAIPEPKSQPAIEARVQQPLGEALEDFSRRFDFDVVYPERLVRGLHTVAVEPAGNAPHVLEQILKGTGLVARFTRPDAIILEPARAAGAPDMTLDRLEVRPPGPGEYRWYGQRLLDASLGMLRTSTGLASKSYDLFVYVWVSDDGTVTDLRVYGGAGEDREVDLAARVLQGLKIEIPPPLNMPQPVGLRIASH